MKKRDRLGFTKPQLIIMNSENLSKTYVSTKKLNKLYKYEFVICFLCHNINY
jgi:hypothetical protein